MKKYGWFLVLLLAWSPWFVAALQVWNSGTFEVSPANTDPISLGDDQIRELKENIRKRAQVETYWGTDIAGGETGRAREGSARAFYATADPTVLSNSVTDTTGDPNLGTSDDGRLLRRSDTGELKIYNGSAWVQALTSLSGTIDLLGTPLFAKAGADAFDIHAHKARHRLSGSNGAWVNAADGMPLAIQQILTDTSIDAGCATTSTTAIGSQVFGDAGDACFSVGSADGLNFTGRATSNTTIFVLGKFSFAVASGSCEVTANLYLDSIATTLGVQTISAISSGDNADTNTVVVMGYSNAVTPAATHEVALHISDSTDDGCTTTSGALYVFDLGNN